MSESSGKSGWVSPEPSLVAVPQLSPSLCSPHSAMTHGCGWTRWHRLQTDFPSASLEILTSLQVDANFHHIFFGVTKFLKIIHWNSFYSPLLVRPLVFPWTPAFWRLLTLLALGRRRRACRPSAVLERWWWRTENRWCWARHWPCSGDPLCRAAWRKWWVTHGTKRSNKQQKRQKKKETSRRPNIIFYLNNYEYDCQCLCFALSYSPSLANCDLFLLRLSSAKSYHSHNFASSEVTSLATQWALSTI